MSRLRAALTIAAAIHCAAPAGAAQFLRALRGQPRESNITLHKRLHVNTLITEPGTMEIDWAGLYSLSSTNFSMPATFKYTPPGKHIVWGRTEYAVAFDSVDNVDTGGGRATQFSQSVTVAATSVLHDGEKLDIAIAPQGTFFLRGERGARLGAIAIARYDTGRNSMGMTVSWSAATHDSASNAAGTWDVGYGYGRRLAATGTLGKFTPHANLVAERATGTEWVVSVFEGVEFQMTGRLAFDLSAQHLGVRGATIEHQMIFGMTWNLGGGQ